MPHFSDLVYSAGVPVSGGSLWGAGNVYYVNGAGSSVGRSTVTPSDLNPGTKEMPFATLTYALAQCSNDKADVIYVLDYWQPSGETWPISVNKSLVSIIGLPDPATGGPWGGFCPWVIAYASGTNKPVFDVVANNVLIANFGMYASDTGAACVTMDDGASVVRIDNCRFNQGTYGVHLTADDTGYGIEITNCFFQQGLTTGGIYINDDPAHCTIRGNYFNRLAGIAINIAGGAGDVIDNNHVALGANTNGYAITLSGATARAWVNLNYAAYGVENGTTTPFLDSTSGGVNTNNWGLNWFGTAVSAAG